MSKQMIAGLAALAVLTGGAMTHPASAQEIKVGVVLPYTSVNAETAQQMDRGIDMRLTPIWSSSARIRTAQSACCSLPTS